MPDTERIDPLEKTLFRLVGAGTEDQGLIARILEEGAVPADLLRAPGPGLRVATAILVRAFRPPFKLRENQLLGAAEYWKVEEEPGPAAYSLRERARRARGGGP